MLWESNSIPGGEGAEWGGWEQVKLATLCIFQNPKPYQLIVAPE